jgi:hypothetical protein
MLKEAVCPACRGTLLELGFLYSGKRIVPRALIEQKGIQIEGDLLGLQLVCPACGRDEIRSTSAVPRD